jgi:hypothetical protein
MFQNLQGLRNNRVAFDAFDMRDKTHTACVVLVTRIIEALNLNPIDCLSHISPSPSPRQGAT